MPKVKVKRKSTLIDMTAMSDVTVLLLTFFMLTSTFVKKEPVQVNTPGSVSEIKIPETDILQILIDPSSTATSMHIFMSLDKQADMTEILKRVGSEYDIEFTPKELSEFSLLPTFGAPISKMKDFLAMAPETRDSQLKSMGIPNDSINNEFKVWVRNTRKLMNETDRRDNFKIAIKADVSTPYPVVKKVMDDLRDIRENRYNLITSLKKTAASASPE
ncbi:MAG: biopolymer transporter ExbD [Bacteroidales bacterium]|jgi:biopolymer transport protein ExbD|nr:biopolymer transporter ExbD [Bacteroidales bacterium]